MTRAVTPSSRRVPALALVCVLAAACAVRPEVNTAGNTQAPPVPELPETSEGGQPGQERAIRGYRDFLARYPNSPEYDGVARRLADLLLEQAADLQVTMVSSAAENEALRIQAETQAQQAYAEAITYYEYLLEKDLDGPQNTAVLYQLTRAYQESGATRQALDAIDRLLERQSDNDRELYADTRFRQAELLFAQNAYREAELSYRAVVQLGPSVPAYEQSLYKLGWSLFKQERYEDALAVLFAFLDRKITATDTFDLQLSGLPAADREQIDDLFRVISRSFAQLGGVDAVDRHFQGNSGRSYEKQVYLQLARWYVEREQVSEAAGTWLLLAQSDPLETDSPRLAARAIEAYRQADFQARVIELEARFLLTYGLDSEFWTVHAEADYPDVLQLLRTSLRELSSLAHDGAQLADIEDPIGAAEQWYRQYLAWFPEDASVPEVNFQLAELLYESGQYQQALVEYERTAWSYGAHPQAAKAALGALHANRNALQVASDEQRVDLEAQAVDGALRFVTQYPEHGAAPEILTKTGTTLLERDEYERTLRVSEQLLEKASPTRELQQVAWSLRAQALFSTAAYPEAATAYNEALRLAKEGDLRRPALQEGLARATYQQAEQALTRGEQTAAVALYIRAAEIAPGAPLRTTARYDAATVLLEQESWEEAIHWLVLLRTEYTQDTLQNEVSRKLAYAYDRSGNADRAANEYFDLAQSSEQVSTLQSEALLRAAELYSETGALQKAITANELYLERFGESAEVAVEVMQQLADLESRNANNGRRQYWLKAIIVQDRKAGNSRTRVPAAKAALELADIELAAFHRIELINPVQDNLARKIKAMKRALAAFEEAVDYGISPVTTAATYHIASMYDELGRALMDSERPPTLTAEELVEYNVLLVKQAAPFEPQAIDIYASNAKRSGGDLRDPWVERSILQLG